MGRPPKPKENKAANAVDICQVFDEFFPLVVPQHANFAIYCRDEICQLLAGLAPFGTDKAAPYPGEVDDLTRPFRLERPDIVMFTTPPGEIHANLFLVGPRLAFRPEWSDSGKNPLASVFATPSKAADESSDIVQHHPQAADFVQAAVRLVGQRLEQQLKEALRKNRLVATYADTSRPERWEVPPHAIEHGMLDIISNEIRLRPGESLSYIEVAPTVNVGRADSMAASDAVVHAKMQHLINTEGISAAKASERLSHLRDRRANSNEPSVASRLLAGYHKTYGSGRGRPGPRKR